MDATRSIELVDSIPEETWEKVASDVLRGFTKYNLSDPVPWAMQPVEGKKKFITFIRYLTNGLYRTDTGPNATRIAHEVSRNMMVGEGWTNGMWDERGKTHPDMKDWPEIGDPVRIKYALMILILAAALKFHGHPVLMHLLP